MTMQALRVLIVDDASTDAELALRELRRAGFDLGARRVDSEQEMRRALTEFRPHIVLSDFSMPRFDGLQALDIAREVLPDVPFVFVSGTIGEDRAVEAMRRGATDYVLKDRMSRLVPVVRRALQEAGERAARRRAEQWRDGQNRILELIASGAPLNEALDGLMLAVEAQAPGMLCSILLPEVDGDRVRLRTGAAPSLPESYNRAVDGVEVGPAAGSCGTAAYRKEQVIVSDIATDPLWADYRELATRHGLRACWSTPILARQGHLLGTFASYFREPRGPASGELELVASAAHIARIAIEKRRDEAEILRAKERLDLALEASGVALWDNDVTSGRVYLNEHWARLLDQEPKETVTTVEDLAAIAHPDDRQMLLQLASDTMRGLRTSYDAEYRAQAKGGEWKWILSRGKVVERAADGRALRVIGTNVDITGYKLQEQRIARLSRIHAVLSGINSAIVRIRDRPRILEEACRIAQDHGGFVLSWIGMLDEAAQVIRPVAKAGREDGYLEKLDLGIDPKTTASLSLAAEAVARRAPVVCNEIETDGRMRPWRAGALERGYRSVVQLPLLMGDRAVGVLALYSPEPGFFDDEEMKLLVELAGDIAFALETIEKQEKLEYLSYYDALTGLPNRALFLDRAGQQMRARSGEPLMVAMILLNIERFRYINESFGHRGGDELLKLIGRRLEEAFRGKDYLARTGADGFGLVVRGVRDAAAVVHLVESQVLGCFLEPYSLNGTEVRVAAKAGIAFFPADGGDADTLFRNAEAALKKARESGERHLCYSADMNARMSHALSMETRLRKAVEEQQFVLHFQPKVSLGADSVCGLEALLRWNDPEVGLVPPGQFIPLLEETGMILEVGRWAVRHALSQRQAWHVKGLRPPRVAVNVSASQLRQADFVRVIRDSIDSAGVGPHGLDLEITESMIMKDVDNNIAKLRALREMGVNLAIDDFGTGYSSLSYAARLPINALKIDRSFISGMATNPHDMAIVTTIIALARSLNLRVVAEGVETAEQSRLLALVKCDEAQGFLFSKPLPASGIEPLLRSFAAEAAAPEYAKAMG